MSGYAAMRSTAGTVIDPNDAFFDVTDSNEKTKLLETIRLILKFLPVLALALVCFSGMNYPRTQKTNRDRKKNVFISGKSYEYS